MSSRYVKMTGVFVARFQPFHRGHLRVIEKALERMESLVLVIGSARNARRLRNPFTGSERAFLIEEVLMNSPWASRVRTVQVSDCFDDDALWARRVQHEINIANPVKENPATLTAENFVTLTPEDLPSNLPASQLRAEYFRDVHKLDYFRSMLIDSVRDWLTDFSRSSAYEALHQEQLETDAYKASWAKAPYPPIFTTTDSVVLCREHVLLVQRKNNPGRGLWALPGGYLNPDERTVLGAIRELREETSLDLSDDILKAALQKVHVFDYPLRSSLGRVITHGHFFCLTADLLASDTPPGIQASDDAAAARWVPLTQIESMQDQFFDDHYQIIREFLGKQL